MKNFILILIIFVFSFFFTSEAMASSVFITSPGEVSIGETFEVLINIDTGGALINSANINLDFDKESLSFSGYKTDNTVMNLWLFSPREENGTITMKGIIPGGVSGLFDPNKVGLSPIPLTRLLFIAKKEGSANFSFLQTEILQNDGKGTALFHEQKNDVVIITSSNTNLQNDTDVAFDKNPPEPFTIYLIKSSLFSRTPRMLAFEAIDADSGVREYKMRVGLGEWKDAQNPQPISKNIFSRNITIRAFDFYDNFQDASIIVPGAISLKLLLIALFIVGFSGVWALKLLKYKA